MSDLRALAEAATPGPWTTPGISMRPFGYEREGGRRMVYDPDDNDLARAWEAADAAYIAACDPQTILALLDEVDRLTTLARCVPTANGCTCWCPVCRDHNR